MIKTKEKNCKGTGKAKGFGCGNLSYKRTYGLCDNCLKEWAYNTYLGHEYLAKTSLRKVRKEKKDSKPKRKYVKWIDKPTNEMITYIQDNIVNPYIRMRDIHVHGIHNSISGGGKITDAGHFYTVKNNQKLRFCVQNIHGQSLGHNRDIADPGHLNEYRIGLINRYGENYLKELQELSKDSNNWPKLLRVDYIEIGKTYERLTKKRIWCFRHEEFLNYMRIINK
jgi:hypothetical protein